MGYMGMVLAALAVVLVSKIWQIFKVVIWRPYVLTKTFEKQGIRGPPYKLIHGNLKEIRELDKIARQTILDTNSNDFVPRIIPHFHKWISQYGGTVLYWFGTQPRITITDPEQVKQILSNKFGFYGKPKARPEINKLMGNGLASITGVDWVKHRRILNPAFTIDKLKVMITRMATSTIDMLDDWKKQAMEAENQCATIEMNDEFQKLTADIIAHTAFGSSYLQGKEAFVAQKELQKHCIAAANEVHFPGRQYLPTLSNIKMWKLDYKVRKSLMGIIKSRFKSQGMKNSENSYGDDLLGLMIGGTEMGYDATKNSRIVLKLNMEEIVHECKTFFFAGHETTSNWLTWTIFMLCMHQDWQQKLREEVLEVCDMNVPNADMLNKLKLVNLVLLETLRLYCPVILTFRKASEDLKLGNLLIPKDTTLTLLLAEIHSSKEQWGEDALEFKPLRFINGVSKAGKHPNALLAFAMGPRACIGQNFAMLEAKTVLALILQRFSFSLSPDYKHTPVDYLTLQPQFGLPVIVNPLN